VTTLRRLHPAPPAIKASAIVKGRILFATGFIFPLYSMLPDTLLGAVRCIIKGTSVTHQAAERKPEDLAQQESLIRVHELAPVSNTGKGNGCAGAKRAHLTANLLKYEAD